MSCAVDDVVDAANDSRGLPETGEWEPENWDIKESTFGQDGLISIMNKDYYYLADLESQWLAAFSARSLIK